MAGSPWTNQVVDLIILTEQTAGFSGLFGYSPSPGAGNLIFSLAAKAGTDPYGNAYPQGLDTTLGSISGTTFMGTDFIINSAGAFFYSSTPGTGNLIASTAGTAGADSFGNNYVTGQASYGAGFAAATNAGFVQFYAGSLAGGWTTTASVTTDASGDVFLLAAPGRSVTTTNNTLDDGSGNMAVTGLTVNGSSSTGGPNDTGFFNTQGLASGSYGSTHQHTLPNFPTATHGHPL